MNPLFQQIGQTTATTNSPNSMQGVIKRFQDFKKSFSGDPQQQIQQLLNSGKVSQAQYNRAVQIAQQLQQLLK